jgi:RNA polymerase sigma factor (sigma-70 family)
VNTTVSDATTEQQHRFCHCMQKIADSRDKEAFEVIFDHFAPLVRAFSLAREPGAALMADELAQMVLIKVWEKAITYNASKASVSTWIYTLARNCRVDLLRRNGRYTSEIDPEYLWHETGSAESDPFLEIQKKRSEKNISEAFMHLPQDQRDVIVKVYMEGKSHQESAEELKLPLGTIKSRVRLALQKLKILVER